MVSAGLALAILVLAELAGIGFGRFGFGRISFGRFTGLVLAGLHCFGSFGFGMISFGTNAWLQHQCRIGFGSYMVLAALVSAALVLVYD